MLRTLLHAAHSRYRVLRAPLQVPPLPPTAREALGSSVTAEEAITYNRVRVATATGLALHRSGLRLPLADRDLDTAVRRLGFPYSRPSPATRAAIRAALGVLTATPDITADS
ncbi:hypothetical protein ACFQ7N_36900 [Streptomyces niveus]|uniref:hypothetical protein n=1 Tax=Streptomyces niveus TaxID=193462 RepID=UPI0036BB5989